MKKPKTRTQSGRRYSTLAEADEEGYGKFKLKKTFNSLSMYIVYIVYMYMYIVYIGTLIVYIVYIIYIVYMYIIYHLGTMMSQSSSVLNTGFILWVQQFAAMFLKRFFHSIRFWQAIIWQLVIPLIFVLFGLIVAKVVPKLDTRVTSTPSRVLSIDNSAPSNNVSLFWASFDPSLSFTVSASYVEYTVLYWGI